MVSQKGATATYGWIAGACSPKQGLKPCLLEEIHTEEWRAQSHVPENTKTQIYRRPSVTWQAPRSQDTLVLARR